MKSELVLICNNHVGNEEMILLFIAKDTRINGRESDAEIGREERREKLAIVGFRLILNVLYSTGAIRL